MDKGQNWNAEAELERMEAENPKGYEAFCAFSSFMWDEVWEPELATGKPVKMMFAEQD